MSLTTIIKEIKESLDESCVESCVECYEQTGLNKITYNGVSYLLCNDCYTFHMEENANDVK